MSRVLLVTREGCRPDLLLSDVQRGPDGRITRAEVENGGWTLKIEDGKAHAYSGQRLVSVWPLPDWVEVAVPPTIQGSYDSVFDWYGSQAPQPLPASVPVPAVPPVMAPPPAPLSLAPQAQEADDPDPAIYVVVGSRDLGLTSDGEVVFGKKLVRVRAGQYDILAEDISQAGSDILAGVHEPEGGFKLGAFYTFGATNISRDYESSQIDGWDLQAYLYEGPLPDEGAYGQPEE